MYRITSLFFYKPLFTLELMIAVYLYSRCLKKRDHFVLRATVGTVLLFTVSILFPIVEYNSFWMSVMFLFFFATEIAFSFFCYNESVANIMFCSIAGYTTQHLASAVYNFVITVTDIENNSLFGYGSTVHPQNIGFWTAVAGVVYIDIYIIVYWLLYLYFGSKIQKDEDFRLKRTSFLLLTGLIIVINIVINTFAVVHNYEVPDRMYMGINHVYNSLCCILVLLFMFGMIQRKKLTQEIDIMQQVWSQQKKQYTIAKDSIDRINLKCHDLKHQVHQIAEGFAINDEAIQEMESVISIYDAKVKTGNEALDTILTEKSLVCVANNIHITCLADGKQLNFMKDADIYTLFGNAVDNAIEAVMRLRDPMQRTIGLKVKKNDNFLCIHIYNYFDGNLQIKDGYPVTVKQEKEEHGFGIRSMSEIVNKYGGTITYNTENQIFNLNIIFSDTTTGEPDML